MRFNYSFDPKSVKTVGLVTYTPTKRRLVPLVLLEIFAFVTVFILVLKYYPSEDFRDVNNLHYIPRKGYLNSLKQQRIAESANANHESPANLRQDLPEYVASDSVNQVDGDTAGILSPSSVSALWEQPTLLNLTNFKWLANNESRCLQTGASPKKLVPVLVHSARTHFQNRKAIRDSWASVQDLYKDWDVRPVFLLGQASLEPVINKVEKNGIFAEQQIFGDLVMGNFVDVYHNLSYKHLMGYKWILNFCQNATFVIKMDDDIFLDIFNWLDWRNQDLRKESTRGSPSSRTLPDFYCMTYSGTPPIRNSSSKYYVGYDEWPETNYPDYCSGHAYGITVSAIRKIYSVSKVQKFVWIDDAYITGILRQHAEKQFGWKPVIKDIWPHVSHDVNIWLPFCQTQRTGLVKWMQQRRFKSVVALASNEPWVSDCLWVKILFDKYINKVVNNLSIQGLAAMFNGTLV